jgi:hypothetical protein
MRAYYRKEKAQAYRAVENKASKKAAQEKYRNKIKKIMKEIKEKEAK